MDDQSQTQTATADAPILPTPATEVAAFLSGVASTGETGTMSAPAADAAMGFVGTDGAADSQAAAQQPGTIASGVVLNAEDHAAGHSLLAEAEQLALFWGGEVGTKMRNLVLRARDKFTA